MEPLVKVQGLKKHFPVKKGIFSKTTGWVKAVDGISFKIEPGKSFGLAGESGCGKSTAGRLTLGLIQPTSGKVIFENQDILSLSKEALRQIRRKMGILYQDPQSSLNPRMRVIDIIGRPLEIHGIAKGDEKKRHVTRIMEEVGLGDEHLYRYPHQFSGGQKQRIAIARSIITRPNFVVLDEPTSALDVSVQAQILRLLKSIQEQFNLSYLFITHDVNVIGVVCDTVAIMYLGKFVEMTSRENLFRDPLHPYTQALLSATPIPDPDVDYQKIVLEGEVPSPLDPPSGCAFHTRCPKAELKCSLEEPQMIEVKRNHYVSCYML